jgi:hypothetical protein
MFTNTEGEVDDSAASLPGLWLSVSDLAKARGVSKNAISKILKRWGLAGTPASVRREGRQLLVNVAEFDRIKGEATDLSQQRTSASDDPTYVREQTRMMGYKADLARLELEEKLGRLVDREDMERACERCGAEIRASIECLSRRTDDIAAAMTAAGAAVPADAVKALRLALKGVEYDVCVLIADQMKRMAEEAAREGES